jgi:hypothetical protein
MIAPAGRPEPADDRRETDMLRPTAAALLATAGMAAAHPGHEAAAAEGAAHWLTDPAHWAVLALGALVLAEIARRGVARLLRLRAAKTDT